MITDNTKKLMLFVLPPIIMVPLFLFFLAWVFVVTQEVELDQDSIIHGYHVIEPDQITALYTLEDEKDRMVDKHIEVLQLEQAYLNDFQKMVSLDKNHSEFNQIHARLLGTDGIAHQLMEKTQYDSNEILWMMQRSRQIISTTLREPSKISS